MCTIVIPAKAGISGRKDTDLLAETPVLHRGDGVGTRSC
jgi:hypothetical protein